MTARPFPTKATNESTADYFYRMIGPYTPYPKEDKKEEPGVDTEVKTQSVEEPVADAKKKKKSK